MPLLFAKLAKLLIIGALISIGEIAFNTVVLVSIAHYATPVLRFLYQSSDP